MPLTGWVIRGTWSGFQSLVLSPAPGNLQVLQKEFKGSSCQIALILANVTLSFSFCHCGLPPWTKINLHARGKMDKGLLLKYKVYPINSENFERCYSPRGVRCEDSRGCRAALAAFLRRWGTLLMKPCLSEIQARTEAVFTTFLLSVPAQVPESLHDRWSDIPGSRENEREGNSEFLPDLADLELHCHLHCWPGFRVISPKTELPLCPSPPTRA